MELMFNDSYRYLLPAEWEKHSATQLHWPSNRDTWPGERLQRVERVYLEVIYILHRYEPILLLVDQGIDTGRIKELLLERGIDLDKIDLYSVPLNDVWARDCGPVFVRHQDDPDSYAITDWEYNSWGEKYPPFQDDNQLPKWFAEKFNIPRYQTGMVLEGGSIETNGQGVLITTESVLLNRNRNPDMTIKEIEAELSRWLGIESIIWLKSGLAGDDTDGHVDDLSRFLNQNTILTMVCENKSDINYPALQQNLEILKSARDNYGNPFHIVTLPLPETKIEGTTVDGSEYIPASYANFYIANGVVLVPLYDDRYDREVIKLLGQYFPDRDIIGIQCADLVWGQGSIHCITQQLYGL